MLLFQATWSAFPRIKPTSMTYFFPQNTKDFFNDGLVAYVRTGAMNGE